MAKAGAGDGELKVVLIGTESSSARPDATRHHAHAVYTEDLAAAARAIRRGLTTSRALVEACLRRYDEREPAVHAFAWLDRDRALRLADAADDAVRSGHELGLLHGLPIGVKDIFDTAGIPTENGSALYTGRVPDRGAAAVEALESAGAIVIGKTVTTELAFYQPGPTLNPHDPSRTPGGSSMGSAASVAAGMLPGAIGSQTNGSVIRPAAFCGVVGAKPTYGRISLDRVMPFAPTLDHAGTFTRTVEGAAWLCAALAREPLATWWSGPAEGPPRFGAIRTRDWERASEPMRERFQKAVDAIASAGRAIEWPSLPPGLDEAVPVLRTIMARESVVTIGTAIARDPSKASGVARALVAEGRTVGDATYRAALAERDRLIAAVDTWASPYDAILTLATTGEAPTTETTGDPIFCSRWSLTG
ncbi:MAG: amidase, partial [Chloroflexi bacterium]|nr:amidase [Chloroflexota bacterium]